MNVFLTLWRREIAAYFLSPIAYVFMVFFLLIMGLNFFGVVQALAEGGGNIQVMQAFFTWIFFWIPMLVVGPLLTMLIMATTPIFTIVFGVAFLRERVGLRLTLAALVTVAGVMLAALDGLH